MVLNRVGEVTYETDLCHWVYPNETLGAEALSLFH